MESYSGKSAICLALALKLKENKFNTGYIKPVGTLPIIVDNKLVDEDACCMHKVLNEKDDIYDMSPVILNSRFYDEALLEQKINKKNKIRNSFSKIENLHDIVLIEGPTDLIQGSVIDCEPKNMMKMFDTKSILVIKASSVSDIDKVLWAKKLLGDSLIGVVFVSVPKSKINLYKNSIVPFLKNKSIDCFGIIPLDKILASITVEQIEKELSAQILTSPKKKNNLIESFLVGAMGQESALKFFRKKENKAVITGGDRADIQSAALETPTRCIILTGNLYPSATILSRAEELHVPILLVRDDTWTTVQKIENLTGRLSMDKPVQVRRMKFLIDEYFDYGKLLKHWKI